MENTNARSKAGSLSILLLSIGAFFVIALVRACDPLVPSIARSFDVGIAEATAPVTAFVLAYGIGQLAYGPIGSRFGSYRTAAVGCTITALLTVLCAIAVSLEQLSVARALAGLAAGAILPMSLAHIGETVAYEDRQSTVSRFMVGPTLGSVAGFSLAGAFSTFLDWRIIFVVTSLGLFGVSIGLWRQLPLIKAQRDSVTSRNPIRQYTAIVSRRWPQVLLTLAALEGFFILGTLPIVAVALFQLFSLSDFWIGIVLGCLGLGALVYALYAKPLVAKLGEVGCALVGGALVMVGYIFIAAMNDLGSVTFGALSVGFGYMMLQSTLQTNATQMVAADRSGSVTLFSFCLYVGQAAGVAVLAALTAIVDVQVLILLSAFAAGSLGMLFTAAKTYQHRIDAAQ